MTREVRVVPYDHTWPARYEQERNRISRPKSIFPTIKIVGQEIENVEGTINLGGTLVRTSPNLRLEDAGIGFEIKLRPVPVLRKSPLVALDALQPGCTAFLLSLESVPPLSDASEYLSKF